MPPSQPWAATSGAATVEGKCIDGVTTAGHIVASFISNAAVKNFSQRRNVNRGQY
jgi:hypothetical protein